MLDTPQITQTDPQLTAYIHLTIPREEIQKVMGPGIGEVMSVLAAQGISPAGPWFTHHLRMDPQVFDFEICVPVNAPVIATGRVKAGQLRATKVARTIYRGEYGGLGAAWGEFRSWITDNGLTADADLWECYLAGPESSSDPAMWRTELNQPLLDSAAQS
ncbi:MAG: GyrI-like domain-containing protein [Noviherbaspirillum sp.]